jgi:primary-amine oxidase
MIGFLEAENLGHTPSFRPSRIARVQVIVRGQSDSNELFELLVDLNSKSIEQKKHLVGKHAYIDTAYMQDVEKACRADPRIQDEIMKLNLPEGASVVIEPWAYATDGMNDMSKRTTMVSPMYLLIYISTSKRCLSESFIVLVLCTPSERP